MPDTINDAQEHPIIFNEWSIQRILAGEKTQTRRILKGVDGGEGNGTLPVIQRPGDTHDDGKWYARTPKTRSNGWDCYDDFGALVADHCPYGQPGDVLWVREGFKFPEFEDDVSPRDLVDYWVDEAGAPPPVKYSTGETKRAWNGHDWGRKRPSIHMPRELCRLRLRVEDVWVQRVQRIGNDDAKAEGIEPDAPVRDYTAREKFSHLWSEIHGDGAWERNDWVWVITFSRINNA